MTRSRQKRKRSQSTGITYELGSFEEKRTRMEKISRKRETARVMATPQRTRPGQTRFSFIFHFPILVPKIDFIVDNVVWMCCLCKCARSDGSGACTSFFCGWCVCGERRKLDTRVEREIEGDDGLVSHTIGHPSSGKQVQEQDGPQMSVQDVLFLM